MKKLFCLMLAIILFPVVSLADLPDISGLSSDELIELTRQISFKLFGEKLTNGVEVPSGEYIIGTDIPAGTYRLEVCFPNAGGSLSVSNEKGQVYHSFLGEFWGVVEIGKIVLTDGSIFNTSSSLRFFPYTGLFN